MAMHILIHLYLTENCGENNPARAALRVNAKQMKWCVFKRRNTKTKIEEQMKKSGPVCTMNDANQQHNCA